MFTPDQFCIYLSIFLKIDNTLVTSKICIITALKNSVTLDKVVIAY